MINDGVLRIAVIGAGRDSAHVRALADAGANAQPGLVIVDDIEQRDPDAVLVLGPGGADAIDRLFRTGVPVVAVGEFAATATTRLPGATATDVIAAVVCGLAGHHRRLVGELGDAERCQLQVARQLHELHDEMVLAAGIQQEFIPREPPALDGLELGVLQRPSSFVSGDIYRVERLDERRVALLVADAVGHGLSAGLLTMFLCSRFTHAIHAGTHCPGAILHGMNNSLLACPGRPKLATAACAVIDETTGEVIIAAAGHPYPVLVTPRGGELLKAGGMLLGVCEDAQYETKSLTMTPGDTLVVYTDGLDVLCPEHLVATACGVPTEWIAGVFATGRPLEAAIAAAEARLDSAAGSLRYPDDITLAAARYTGVAARIAA